jgi:L-cysteine S-thiosulfotransferase
MRSNQSPRQQCRPHSGRAGLAHLSASLCTVLAAFLALGCAGGVETPDTATSASWKSRATAEARGDIREDAGNRVQLRYNEEPFTLFTGNFEKWPTYAYTDTRTFPGPSKIPMPAIKGDPSKGRELFLSRAVGPCTGCHLIPGDDVWPAGAVGPDLSVIGDRRLPDQYLFDFIWDARVLIPSTSMPPWGTAAILSPEQVTHIVAFLQTLKGNPPFVPPPEKDPARNPYTRPRPAPYYGDNLDPANNPAIVRAEGAMVVWATRGPAGRACADCHEGGPQRSMKGVATVYPKYVPAHRRVMSIEDLLAVHASERTGIPMLAGSNENLDMTMLIKMQSNGMPVNVDVTSPEARAALERGRALYYKRVGQRNHMCADCHDADRGAGRFIGGRLLSVAANGLTRHLPTLMAQFQVIWNVRKRFQFCMVPLGGNYLAADAPEYADLELYFTAFDNGKAMSVPGIR